MFSGLNEIILIVFIAVAVIFLPGFFSKRQKRNSIIKTAEKKLSWKIRLAVMFSFAWASGTALIFRPWDKDPVNFILYGVAPILVCAGIAWVVQGYRSGS